jgi:hypothetical protein
MGITGGSRSKTSDGPEASRLVVPQCAAMPGNAARRNATETQFSNFEGVAARRRAWQRNALLRSALHRIASEVQ